MTDDACEHDWKPAQLTSGQSIEECSKCPRWRMGWMPPRRNSRIENHRRSMEGTSRYLGEHRDV